MATEFLSRIICLILCNRKRDQTFLIAWWITYQHSYGWNNDLLSPPPSPLSIFCSQSRSQSKHEMTHGKGTKIWSEFIVRLPEWLNVNHSNRRTEDKSNSIKINGRRRTNQSSNEILSCASTNCSVGTLLQSTVHRTIYLPIRWNIMFLSLKETIKVGNSTSVW